MSGQARLSRVRALYRHRCQVERLISTAQPVDRFDDWAFGRRFDVHAARELGRRMVAMADEQTVFEDWCRELGRGPEAVGLRVRCLDECIECICDTNPETTDGPDVGCPHHGWVRRTMAAVRRWGRCECSDKYPGDGTTVLAKWPGKLAASYDKAGGQASAAMGRSLARQGQRLLDVLEGQPSECQAASCDSGNRRTHFAGKWSSDQGKLTPIATTNGIVVTIPCHECRGTGHNLRGVMPSIEFTPAQEVRLERQCSRPRTLEHAAPP